jgi:hypothetical protein
MAKPKSDVDYLKIAKQRAHRPSQKTHHPKLLCYSRNKKGKTTFGLSAGVDNTIVLDPESGTDAMLTKDPHVWPVSKWEDVQEFWGAIRTMKLSPYELGTGKSKDPFTWVSGDGLTKLNNMALKFVGRQAEQKDLDRRPGMVQRPDYNKSGQLMKDFIDNLFSLKMGVVFTAQERMTTLDSGDHDEDEETTYFVPDLPAGVRGTINSVVDVIGRLYVVTIETKDGTRKQRRMQIGPHERYDTGYRSDYVLPDVLKNPTIPKLVALMHTGEVN